MNDTTVADGLEFLVGGGEMGERIRQYDWSGTPLGPPQYWPQALRLTLSICLRSSFPTAIYWGPEQRLLYNDAWAPVPAEKHPWALGRRAREVWPEIWHVIEPQLQHVLRTGEAFSTFDELLPMKRAGRIAETYWNYSFTPIQDEQGAIVGIFNQGHETTAKVISARAGRAEVERLREYFQHAPAAVAVLRGPAHVFEMVNPAYQQIIGDREVIGKPLAQAIPELEAQGFVALLDQVYSTGLPHTGHAIALQLQRRAGDPPEQRVLDFVYQPVRDASQVVTGVFVQVADITQRKAAEDQRELALHAMREADRRKDEFLATLAHEIRNPLAPIRNGLHVIRHSIGEDARLQRVAQIMERQMSHLVRLVDDLLDISRITRGKVELRSERVSLHEVLASAIDSSSSLFESRRQELSVEEDSGELIVIGDFDRLTQVCANLLSNAAKYTLPGGRVQVQLRRESGHAVLVVRDDGIGMTPEDIDNVFGMFWQAAGRDPSNAGLGIGLALVQELVQRHGGTVQASSPGPGLGSEFVVRLPLTESESGGDRHALESAEQGSQRRLRILIADDNEDASATLVMILAQAGHETLTARDGVEALEIGDRLHPDLVVLDIGMPRMDGYTTAQHMRERDWGRSVRIVALTGWGQVEDKRRAFEAGIDEHLTKPIDPAKILELLCTTASR